MGALDDLNNLIKAEGFTGEGETAPPKPAGSTGETEPVKVKIVPEEDKRSKWQKQVAGIKESGGWSKLAERGQAQAGGDDAVGQAESRRAMRRQGSAQQRAARASRPVQTQKAFNPALASLLAVAAGVVSSDSFVSGAGGRTNKDITAGQLAAFERAGRRQTKARQQTKKSRVTKAPVRDIRLAYKEFGATDLTKAHAPVPPIQGLVWDQSARKWRKPENVGKTASEVQGKKRIRGSGLGQQSRSAGGSGSGKGRGREFSHGRRARAASGDIGVAGTSTKHSAKKRRTRKN